MNTFRMDESEVLETQQQRFEWMTQKRRQRETLTLEKRATENAKRRTQKESLTPNRRASENAKRRARHHANDMTHQELQFPSPSMERRCGMENQQNATSSPSFRMPMLTSQIKYFKLHHHMKYLIISN